MNTLQWGPELETGIPELDTQHKRIVFLVNHMYETRQSKDLEAVGDVITEMVDYALSHFAFEEALMEDAQYRFLGPHKRCMNYSLEKFQSSKPDLVQEKILRRNSTPCLFVGCTTIFAAMIKDMWNQSRPF
jgi:hemerythrin-like metal-binding protein